MSLDSVFKPMITKIWQEDADTQLEFLRIICESRQMPVFDMKKYDMFFVPNNDYLKFYGGQGILDWALGCYDDDDDCIWNNCLIFPIKNVVGEIVGLGGFNPFRYAQAHETQSWDIYYYQYSSKSVFTKGNYLYYAGDSFDKALDDGYLIVVDGLFDAISLNEAGFNAAAMMGSSVTDAIVLQLRFIPNVIVARDNDAAGAKLANTLVAKLKNCVVFNQLENKDIDGALKSENRRIVKEKLEKLIKDVTNK